MNNEKFREEDLEKVTGGGDLLAGDLLKTLKYCIENNKVEGAANCAMQLTKGGFGKEVKEILDAVPKEKRNEAWEKANIFYTVML